ncbi:hypothetical protein L5515_014028 [Caenorhabditis briggsae]|nr:hypothetical protein L3Y34_017903 [Caenorhabditis briggsae]UMM17525.1 hypothetical protein L5515_014028 [Caenorhabditis briggsae]
MGDELSENSKSQISSSMENIQRKLILLEIEKNEKSSFDDVITGAESDNGWESIKDNTEDSINSNWQMTEEITSVSSPTLQEYSDGPQSFYELDALNHKPVDNTFRTTRVPSQYQLDALSEMFIFDLPQHIALQRMNNSCQAEAYNVIDQDAENRNGTPYFINSEYVSEML